MKPVIKAIQTHYKGYRFRSRLEARWAVFFDACEIKWQYEPEGFLLNSGESYLPDFYLPDEKIHAEVKSDSGDFRKARLFCETTQKKILLLEGVPELKYYSCFKYDETNESEATEDVGREFFNVAVTDSGYKVVLSSEDPYCAWWDRSDVALIIGTYGKYSKTYESLKALRNGFLAVTDAVNKARGARFEFGENGE